MLQPRRTKYRKRQKGRNDGIATRGTTIEFGSFAMKALENKHLTSRQIEAARIAMTRHMKREGRVWLRVFPDKPITKKPQEVRMGKGKGALDHYVAEVQPGRIIFEIDGIPIERARRAIWLASQKLPFQTKFIVRKDYVE